MEVSNALYESARVGNVQRTDLHSKVQGPSKLECNQKGGVGCRLQEDV